MKKKTKLSFEMLEMQIEKICNEEARNSKGGDGPGDCMFQAIAFATGQSVESVQQAYADYAFGGNPNISPEAAFAAVGMMGVNSSGLGFLINEYGLSSGYTSWGPGGVSSEGDVGIILMDMDNNGSWDHAVNVTGNDGSTGFYVYDAQSGATYTMSNTDSRIRAGYTP